MNALLQLFPYGAQSPGYVPNPSTPFWGFQMMLLWSCGVFELLRYLQPGHSKWKHLPRPIPPPNAITQHFYVGGGEKCAFCGCFLVHSCNFQHHLPGSRTHLRFPTLIKKKARVGGLGRALVCSYVIMHPCPFLEKQFKNQMMKRCLPWR